MNPDFEKYIRQTLQTHEDQVDAEAIWQNVEPHVRPEKKRRFFWWFFFGGMAILFGLSIWAYSQMNLPAQHELTDAFGTKKQESNTTLPQKSTIKVLEKETSEIKNNPIDNTLLSEEIELKAENPLEKTTLNNSNKTTLLNNEKPAKVAKAKSLDVTKIITKKTVDEITNQQGNIKNKTAQTNPLDISKEVKLGTKEIVVPQHNIPGFAVEKTRNETLIKLNGGKRTAEKNMATLLFIPSLTMNLFDPIKLPYKTTVETRFEEDRTDEEEDDDITPLSKPGLRWGIGAYGSIGRASPFLEMKDERLEYISNRKNTEEQLELLSFGLSLTTQTKKNISLRTGLEYNRIARRFTFDEAITTYDTITDGVVKIYLNFMTNDTIVETGQVINSSTDTHEKETFNFLHRLDVPLLVGYTFAHKRWSIGLEAGALFNISLRRKGEILDVDEETLFYDLKTDSKKWYKSNVGLSPLVQMNFNCQLNKGLEIHASPYFHFKRVYSTDVNPVKESYSAMGLQLGLRYWLRN